MTTSPPTSKPMAPASQPTSFLDIPRELRQHIFYLVFNDTVQRAHDATCIPCQIGSGRYKDHKPNCCVVHRCDRKWYGPEFLSSICSVPRTISDKILSYQELQFWCGPWRSERRKRPLECNKAPSKFIIDCTAQALKRTFPGLAEEIEFVEGKVGMVQAL